MKWFSIVAAIGLMISCFFPWVVVPGRDIVISGMKTEGTNYGKPAYLNMLLLIIFIVFALIPRLWAKRINLFVSTLNFTWSIRNFLLLSRCEAGECPVRQQALYLYLLMAFVVLVFALLTPPEKSTANP